MATQSMSSVKQQLWDEMLNSLLTLSDATLKENLKLEAQVAELEVELSVWKQAHSVALEAQDREAKAHNVHIASLNKQISNTDGFRGNGNPLILCAINGQNMFFNHSLLVQGFMGGQTAAQHLTNMISEYLSSEGVHIFGRLSFWVSIYFSKVELINSLIFGQSVCSLEQLEAFLAGFSQKSPRFIVVDVGVGEEEADNKIREYIQTYTRFPETLRVFLGGCSESLYSGTFNRLDSEKLLGKLVALRSVADEWSEQTYTIPSLNVDRLLQLTPLSVASLEPITSNGGLVSPQSPVRIRYVDPKFVKAPPPCNEHYLMTCSKGAGACKYSHEYVLSHEQLRRLANWLKNGLQCPYGEACCWGHVCPNGSRCFHLSKGKCWFKGEGMHNMPTAHPTST
ncbi:hypothetical protein BT96DRAFT_952955 [Gymnopus androsaceus JB14]|uniref:C3H1-type domain-containing protein n=1 Tax=Gymnopus androsaceus JB14 TaxID=1447944 RepID=A0A6A4IL70_9AGAR|nr:hypothetical protein BT96DRAFT_952955 [Gymnopus androsaceus JB14]